MARTLETLAAGTPVFCGEMRVGEVRALYTEGSSRAVEWVVVYWTAEKRQIAIQANEIESVTDAGVRLMHNDPRTYAELPSFEEARFPTAHKLA
jgi:hypothetical protein